MVISRKSFAAGGALASFAIVRGRARAAQFEFKCGANQPATHPLTIRLAQMWSAVERESGGRIGIQFFPNGSLGGDAAMFAQLRVGALQFFQMTPANLASVVPAVDICYLGFAFRDADEAHRVMDGALGEYLRNEVAAKGIHATRTIWESGMLQVSSSTHPIRTPDDLHGFKVRVTESRILVDLFKTLGASATPMSFSEAYTSLQTKIVDGQAAALTTIETSRFYEVQKYVSLTNHAWSGQWLIANADAWKSLPADLQEIIERNNTRFGLLERRDAKAGNASVSEMLTKQGMVFNTVDQVPFRAPLRPYYESWAATFGSTEWTLLQNAVGHRFI